MLSFDCPHALFLGKILALEYNICEFSNFKPKRYLLLIISWHKYMPIGQYV